LSFEIYLLSFGRFLSWPETTESDTGVSGSGAAIAFVALSFYIERESPAKTLVAQRKLAKVLKANLSGKAFFASSLRRQSLCVRFFSLL